MEQFEIENIMHNLMKNLEIDGCFKETIQKLVEQYWPRKVLYLDTYAIQRMVQKLLMKTKICMFVTGIQNSVDN